MGSPAPSTIARNAAVARSSGTASSGGKTPESRTPPRMSSAAWASVRMSSRPSMLAAPLMVCASRNSESTAWASASPDSIATRTESI